MNSLQILVVSDSTGETGEVLSRAWTSQFPDLNVDIVRRPHVTTKEAVDALFKEPTEDTIIVNSVVMPAVTRYLKEKCRIFSVPEIDLFNRSLDIIEQKTGVSAKRLPGLTRELDVDYFNKISSIEFAVKYDDGKDKRGLLKADIVLLGISRTSKTPLSMFMANKGYNVANLPLLPEVTLPKEIARVDPKRIIGLIISPDKLNTIRTARLAQLGIGGEAAYAAQERIRQELEYAKNIFSGLGCKVIDVSDSTIEQTATSIIQHMKDVFGNRLRRYEEA